MEEYIIREINKVYELQSASISRKHTEIIIRQMPIELRQSDVGFVACACNIRRIAHKVCDAAIIAIRKTQTVLSSCGMAENKCE